MVVWVFVYEYRKVLIVLRFGFRGTGTVSRETTMSKYFGSASAKESTPKGKNLLPLGANSFLLE